MLVDEIMVLTAQDLLLKFNAVTAYTQSDEISLIFPALKQTKEDENKTLAFGGRVLKLCTLASCERLMSLTFSVLFCSLQLSLCDE